MYVLGVGETSYGRSFSLVAFITGSASEAVGPTDFKSWRPLGLEKNLCRKDMHVHGPGLKLL